MFAHTIMPKPLAPEQLAALQAVPLGVMPNKLGIAIAMTRVKQGDIAAERDLSTSAVSNAVNGKGVTSVETAREIAAFFGCPIEILWPPPDDVPQPSLFAGDRRACDDRRKVPA